MFWRSEKSSKHCKKKSEWLDYLYQWMALVNLCFIILWFLLGEGYAPEGTIEYQIVQLLILGVFGGWVSLITRGVSKNNSIPGKANSKIHDNSIPVQFIFSDWYQ